MVGLSTYTGYNFNERAMLSLGIVDNELSEPGTEVTVVWGEENGGTTKPTVERHAQIEIRATVQPVPISEVARVAYRPRLRQGSGGSRRSDAKADEALA